MSSDLLTPAAPDLSSGVFTDTTPRGVAVAVRGLSKSYSIARSAAQHTTAGEALMHKLRHPFEKAERDTFWALNDVSFDIQKGDVVGIIGRNGAGKSTLLKVLSRITEPTRGKVALYGRVGSLLEVGTGFHPELTGRENIFLNGAILGMSKGEIARQFDAIVDFSGTEQFLDTPVKRYSSGMYVRLAFAVAAHLNPEILIIDEVLAVGDAEFQKKCLGKMQDVADSGRTVLFVSHMMGSVQSLCNKCLLLNKGTLQSYESTDKVIATYITSGRQNIAESVWDVSDAPGDENVRLTAVRVKNSSGENSGDINLAEMTTLEMEFVVLRDGHYLNPVFHVFNAHNVCMFTTSNMVDSIWNRRQYPAGLYRASCKIPAPLLNDGDYYANAIIVSDHTNIHVMHKEALRFQIHEDGTGRGDFIGTIIGVTRPDVSWDIQPVSDRTLSGFSTLRTRN